MKIESAIRSNYFHVKDDEAFQSFMKRVYGREHGVVLWQSSDPNGKRLFCFATYGGIAGVKNAKDDTFGQAEVSAYDEFIDGLQKHVAEDDAIILMDVGHEGLRSTFGHAEIITSKSYDVLDLKTIAVSKAREILNNSNWEPLEG